MNIETRLKIPRQMAQFVPMKSQDFSSNMDGLQQWTLEGHDTQAFNKTLDGIPEKFSALRFQLQLKRIPNYYYLKIISGICMIVFMNFLLFALPIEDSNRIAVSATLFLAIVAYLFLVSNDVPKIAYATRLDNFILLAMFNIFFSTILFQLANVLNRAALIRQKKAYDKWDEKVKTSEETYVIPMVAVRGDAENGVAGPSSSSDVSDNEDHESQTSRSPGTRKKNGKSFEQAERQCQAEEDDGGACGRQGRVVVDHQRPQNEWFDRWLRHSETTEIVQAVVVVLMFILGAPIILWGHTST